MYIRRYTIEKWGGNATITAPGSKVKQPIESIAKDGPNLVINMKDGNAIIFLNSTKIEEIALQFN